MSNLTVFGSLVLLLLFASTVSSVPGDLNDWHTGNTQLHSAINAALFRLRSSGEYNNLLITNNVSLPTQSDPVCLIGAAEGLQVFTYPSNPVGTLKNILTRGYWLVSTAGPYDEGSFGNFLVDPPTGFQPDLTREIARMIGEAYGVSNLGVQYYYTNSSAETFEAVLNNLADSTNGEFSFSVSITLSDGSIHLRSDLLRPTCSTVISPTIVGVLSSLNVTNFDQLVALVSQNPSAYTAASAGGASVTEAIDSLPTGVNVIDYYIKYPQDPFDRLFEDFLNGTYQIQWDFSPEAGYPQFVSFPAPNLDLEAILVRYDTTISSVSSSSSSTPCQQSSPSPSYRPEHCSGTNINFYFDGMIRQ